MTGTNRGRPNNHIGLNFYHEQNSIQDNLIVASLIFKHNSYIADFNLNDIHDMHARTLHNNNQLIIEYSKILCIIMIVRQ